MPSTRATSRAPSASSTRREGSSVPTRRGARTSSRAPRGRSSRSATRAGRSTPRAERTASATPAAPTSSTGRSRSTGPPGETTAAEIATMREEFSKLQQALATKDEEHKGVVTQLQAQIEDLQMSRGGGAASGEVELVGVTEQPAATAGGAAPASSLSTDARRAVLKQSMSDWGNMFTRMTWLVLGEQPVFGTLARDQWQAYLPNIRITAKVALTLNTWTNMRITDWRMESDDATAPVPIDESMEILIGAIVQTLDRSAKSPESIARLQLLEEALQEGLHLVRAHCRANRSAMRDERVVSRFVTFIDDDLRLFTNTWMRAAIDVKAENVVPPELPEHFPAVPVPTFPATRGYINMGGVSNAVFFRSSAASSITSPTKKMRVAGSSSGSHSPRPPGPYRRGTERYCFHFNSPSGCDDPECQYLHEEDPEASSPGRSSTRGPWKGSGQRRGSKSRFNGDGRGASTGGRGDSGAASNNGGSGAVVGTPPATQRSGGARRKASSFFGPKRDK